MDILQINLDNPFLYKNNNNNQETKIMFSFVDNNDVPGKVNLYINYIKNKSSEIRLREILNMFLKLTNSIDDLEMLSLIDEADLYNDESN